MAPLPIPKRFRRGYAPPNIPVHREEAEAALDEAIDHLRSSRGRRGRSRKISSALKEIRERNDYANSIRRALEGG